MLKHTVYNVSPPVILSEAKNLQNVWSLRATPLQKNINLFYIKTLCTFAKVLFMKRFFDFIKMCLQYVCIGFIGQNQVKINVSKKYETLLVSRFQGFLLFFTKFYKHRARLGIV
jgi:hypothetical protein